MTIILTLLAFLWSGPSYSEDGKLPRGAIKANPAFVPPQQSTIIQAAPCGDYNASPINGLNYLAPSREYIYILVKKPTIYNGKITLKSSLFEYEFYRLSLLKFEWERLMTFSKGDISIVIPHGKYTDGITFLTFSEFQDGCFLGNAGGFSATLEGDYKRVEQSVFGKKFAYGRYKILPSSLGRSIADMEKDTIVEVDPKTFQRRTGLKFTSRHVPIYLDYESRRLITLNQAKNPQQLELKLENASEAYKTLQLGTNQKFIREGNQFARMHFENEGRRAIIHTTQEWTAKKENLYKINLPPRFDAQNIAVYPRFVNDTAIVMGLTLGDRKSIRAALVFDLARDKIIHRHIPQEGFYVSYATIGPFGKYAYFVVSHIATGTFHKLFRYDLNKHYYRVLTVKNKDTALKEEPVVKETTVKPDENVKNDKAGVAPETNEMPKKDEK